MANQEKIKLFFNVLTDSINYSQQNQVSVSSKYYKKSKILFVCLFIIIKKNCNHIQYLNCHFRGKI